jgi:hypothetical protein
MMWSAKHRPVATALVALAACQAPDVETPVHYERLAGRESFNSLIQQEGSGAMEIEAFRQRHGLPVMLLVREDAPDSLRARLPIGGDVCGRESVQQYVRRLPVDDPNFEATPAWEFNDQGELLRRWWLPRDVIIAGVRGGEAISRYDYGGPRSRRMRVHLVFGSDGAFHVEEEAELPPMFATPCPELHGLGGFRPQHCFRLIDLSSGASRTVTEPIRC